MKTPTHGGFIARIAASTNHSLLPSPPAIAHLNGTATLDHIIFELRDAVNELVEPAIEELRKHETRMGSQEDCFHAPSQYLRFRCCVYFSSVAASLLQWRFGDLHRASSAATISRAPTAYGALARWLLRPPPLSTPHAVARAEQLISHAESEAKSGDYSLNDLRKAASQLAGPLGQYETRLRIGGVRGTLWRCEVSTVHTFLVFEPLDPTGTLQDVFVDVTYKQFLVLPELMDATHFENAKAARLFADEPDAFVGSAAALEAKMSLKNLRDAFRRIDHSAATGAARLSTRADLEAMVGLRNDGVFALRDRDRRKRLCGRPWQAG